MEQKKSEEKKANTHFVLILTGGCLVKLDINAESPL